LFGSDKQTLLGNSSSVDGSLLQPELDAVATPGGQGSVASEVFGSWLTTPVPEPTTWAMLAGGLALLGFARRRQQA
jgi:hypothetical protein